mgnify:CR=1 FL=1
MNFCFSTRTSRIHVVPDLREACAKPAVPCVLTLFGRVLRVHAEAPLFDWPPVASPSTATLSSALAISSRLRRCPRRGRSFESIFRACTHRPRPRTLVCHGVNGTRRVPVPLNSVLCSPRNGQRADTICLWNLQSGYLESMATLSVALGSSSSSFSLLRVFQFLSTVFHLVSYTLFELEFMDLSPQTI